MSPLRRVVSATLLCLMCAFPARAQAPGSDVDARPDPALACHVGLYALDDGSWIDVAPADLTLVVDPGLPEWIGYRVAADAPKITSWYADRMGWRPVVRPTLMMTWRGATPRMRRMGGSVMPGLVAMTFEGQGMVRGDEGGGGLRPLVRGA